MEKIKKVLKDFSICKKLPSKILHINRNSYGIIPEGTLISKHNGIFIDKNGNLWNQMPWYLSMFHNPIENIKLVHYDTNLVKEGMGSSEIIIAKKTVIESEENRLNGILYMIEDCKWNIGSYNYRDLYITSK